MSMGTRKSHLLWVQSHDQEGTGNMTSMVREEVEDGGRGQITWNPSKHYDFSGLLCECLLEGKGSGEFLGGLPETSSIFQIIDWYSHE